MAHSNAERDYDRSGSSATSPTAAPNVLPWLDEQVNLRKEKNFFETRVTEYQTGGALAWD